MTRIGQNNLEPTPAIGQANINAPGNPIGKKKKKHHFLLWTIIITLIVVIVLPISLIYGFGFDSTHKSPKDLNIKENAQTESLFEHVVVDMFDNANNPDQPSLNIGFSENNINQTLYDATKDMTDLKKMVPALYFLIDEEEQDYTIVIEINLYNIFKTNIQLKTSIEKVEGEKRGVKFNINKIIVGRAGFLSNFMLSLVNNFINDEQIEKSFLDLAGLHIESHLKDKYLFYSLDNLISDINSKLNIDGNIQFFKDFINEMLYTHKFSFDFYSDKKISSVLDISEFAQHDVYSVYYYYNDLRTRENIDSYLLPMLDGNMFTNYSQDEVNHLLTFLAKGYNHISEACRNTIDHYYDDIETYLGMTIEQYSALQESYFVGSDLHPSKPLNEISDDYIEDIVEAQINQAFSPDNIAEIIANDGGQLGPIIITEEQCHDILKASEAVGFGNLFYRLSDEDYTRYKANYFLIDNFFLNIVNDEIIIDFGLDVNGYETNMMMSSSAYFPNPDEAIVYFDTHDNGMYYGNYNCSQNLYSKFLEFVKAALPNSSSESWFTFDIDNQRFVVNFQNTIDDNALVNQFYTTYGSQYKLEYEMNVKGQDYSTPGTIEFYINISPR